jgi:hypothetical protein
MLGDRGAVRIRKGLREKFRPMTKQSPTWRRVQRRLQRSRTRPKVRRQRSERRQRPVPSSSQTRPSGFSWINVERGFEDYRARNSTGTSLVSSRTHGQPKDEDPVVEGAKAEGRIGRKGEGQTLQCHPTDDPDEARVEGEGED